MPSLTGLSAAVNCRHHRPKKGAKEQEKKMSYKTILINGFSRQHGDEPRANGGVELVQIATKNGNFYRRYTNSNGGFFSSSHGEKVSALEVRAIVNCAKNRINNDWVNGRCSEAAYNREMAFLAKYEKFSGNT